jgi:RimJ/RimL family protein N-acetyltransferase
LIGSTGFNEFKLETDEEKAVLRTDVGCLIDWRFHRKGYALETLEAVIQYGFSELRAEKISADTNLENTPWRKLMDIMVS